MSTLHGLSQLDTQKQQSFSKRPSSQEDAGPRKRARSDSLESKQTPGFDQSNRADRIEDNSERGASNKRTQRSRNFKLSRTDSYRPRQNHGVPNREYGRGRDLNSNGGDGQTKRNHRSMRDRKENPSTRIHSLRKQIERRTLPPPAQAEKERELASLLFEREKNKLKEEAKRNLERYHFVRFMERQKAQRTIKRIQKLKASGTRKVHEAGEAEQDIDAKLQELEVDLNYTIYAPLGEKYISIFAEQNKHGDHISKAEKYKGNWKLMKADESRFLDVEQLEKLRMSSMEAANVLEIHGNLPTGDAPGKKKTKPQNIDDHPGQQDLHNKSSGSGDAGVERPKIKPPVWYEVQEAMKSDQKQTKLEALRERKSAVMAQGASLVLGLNPKVSGGDHKKQEQQQQQQPDWLNDNGEIDPADLDSDSDADADEGGVDIHHKRMDGVAVSGRAQERNNDEDEEMSDGDGGFFEKR